jgi:hypothetical protein
MPRASEDGEWAAGGLDSNGNPRFGGTFETELYALLAAFGTTPDGSSIGGGVERFRVFLRFPRYLREEGLAYREAEIDRRQLLDFRLDLENQLERLEAEMESGRFQPIPGSHCGRCPAEVECPIPRHLRPESQLASLDEPAELERMAVNWFFMQRRATQLKSRLRVAADRLGLRMVRIGEWRRERRVAMGTALTSDDRPGAVALYDSVTGLAFGEVFEGPDAQQKAEDFLRWVQDAGGEGLPEDDAGPILPTERGVGAWRDPRAYSAIDLARLRALWYRERLDEDGYLKEEPHA